jgi:hypothetical protein
LDWCFVASGPYPLLASPFTTPLFFFCWHRKLSLIHITTMATNDIPNNLKYTPIGVEGVVEVNAHLVGGSVIDSLRRTFTIDSQMEQGDYFMDRSLDLLEKHLQLMLLHEQVPIKKSYLKSVFNYLCCAAEPLK